MEKNADDLASNRISVYVGSTLSGNALYMRGMVGVLGVLRVRLARA